MSSPKGSQGNELVLLAAALSVQLAEGRSQKELDTLAAFFTILRDNLILFSLKRKGDSEIDFF